MTDTSRTPEPAASYFNEQGLDGPITVYDAFHARTREWVTFDKLELPANEPFSEQQLSDLRKRGYTVLTLQCGGRFADFRISEFWSQVGLGQWRGRHAMEQGQ